MGILEQEMKRLAQQAGGSHKTVHDRIKLAQRFCERLVLARGILKVISVNGWRRDSVREALALTAMDLGHDDGRGRYVVQVYGRREETD